MQTKNEIVKEAWGNIYEICNPDENGWSAVDETRESLNEIVLDRFKFSSEDIEIIDPSFNTVYWRPIALKGLEENNGWRKISEIGLPLEEGYYDFLEKKSGEIYNAYYVLDTFSVFFLDRFSHWTPARKPPRY